MVQCGPLGGIFYEELAQVMGKSMSNALESLVKVITLQNVGWLMQHFTGEKGHDSLTFYQYVLSLERNELKILMHIITSVLGKMHRRDGRELFRKKVKNRANLGKIRDSI